MLDAINALMYQSSTLIGAVILIGALAYIGANAISPSNILLRRLVGYLTAIALLLIGGYSFYFGASKEVTLFYEHIYDFDLFRLEWMLVGALALVAGLLIARQSYRSM